MLDEKKAAPPVEGARPASKDSGSSTSSISCYDTSVDEVSTLRTPLDFALRYAANGWRILPLKPGKKSPAGGLTKHAVYEATTDAAIIEGWFKRCPMANIGLALDRYVVLDFDKKSGGLDTHKSIEAEFGPIQCSAIQRTAGGGWHYLFPSWPTAKGKQKARRGLDILTGADHYIVVEPSVIAPVPAEGRKPAVEGGRYVWLR